jgi:6-phosphogluconate dehydrogenase
MQKVIFITGVSGCGKTTIAELLSKQLNIPFIDADDYHSPESIEKMSAGIPLTDVDRQPWLERLNAKAANSNQLIIACSALKETYRNTLSKGLAEGAFYFIHLQGSFELILGRMQKRTAHFMPQSLLKSQFDTYEAPSKGHIVNISPSIEIIVNQIQDIVTQKSAFGIIGLGVMGTSLARNIAEKGYPLSIFNRHVAGKEEDIAKTKKAQYEELSSSQPFDNLEKFVQSLATPRSIMLMVNAGAPVDYVIQDLLPFLESGDLIIDGGNSHYADTQRRFEALQKKVIHFIGCGVSGGEQGALLGPSIMPGGDAKAYANIKNIMEDIAADAPSGGKCCALIGVGGAGHFVKMVHNGIEYGEMQVIAEVYSILRYSLNYTPEWIANTFKQWASEGINSYLLEITINILLEKNETGQLVLDQILDQAGNKGTGSWTTIAAAQLGVPIPSLTAALFARYQSSFKNERVENSTFFTNNILETNLDLVALKNLYQLSRIMNHHQGICLIKAASDKFEWDINLKSLLKVWSAGCIIRSELLEPIGVATDLNDFIHHDYFVDFFNKNIQEIIQCKSIVTTSGLPTPCISASLDYYNTLIQKETNANMIQAQRDYFGAHTFKLKNNPESNAVHHIWE